MMNSTTINCNHYKLMILIIFIINIINSPNIFINSIQIIDFILIQINSKKFLMKTISMKSSKNHYFKVNNQEI
jgi:hypothetical protein